MTTFVRDQLKEDMKTAMKAKQTERLGVIRMALAKFKEIDIEFRVKNPDTETPEAELIAALTKMVKQRTDSVKTFSENDRQDAADKEQREIDILQAYLPQPLSEDELMAAIKKAIAQTQSTGPNDTGKTVGYLKTHYAGRIDFGKIVPTIRQELGA